MALKSYKDLIAWQKAMDLVVAVYRVSSAFPKEETYGLTAQLRRASISIPSNIAEGQGRRNDKEFCRFLSIAHGSLREAETQIILARRLNYTDESTTSGLLESASEVGRLITGLSNSISVHD
jgi:four helix bundle protein